MVQIFWGKFSLRSNTKMERQRHGGAHSTSLIRFKFIGTTDFWVIAPSSYAHISCEPSGIERSLGGLPYPSLKTMWSRSWTRKIQQTSKISLMPWVSPNSGVKRILIWIVISMSSGLSSSIRSNERSMVRKDVYSVRIHGLADPSGTSLPATKCPAWVISILRQHMLQDGDGVDRKIHDAARET